jgi:hypothetical protein
LPAFAGWGKFTLTDNNGEQVVVKHGLFGKKTIVKDRFGDGFEHNKSIFGLTKDTKVSALGNDVHVHKGLFGFGKTEGQDMLGDTVTSNKNLLFRNTNVNLSGVNGLVDKYFGPKNINNPPLDPGLAKRLPNEALPGNIPLNPNLPITPQTQTQNY